MSPERIKKVAAVLIRPRAGAEPEVLLFDHPGNDGSVMVQLPAGTVEPGEQPEAAAVRELREETGVRGEVVALAGVLNEEWEGEAPAAGCTSCGHSTSQRTSGHFAATAAPRFAAAGRRWMRHESSRASSRWLTLARATYRGDQSTVPMGVRDPFGDSDTQCVADAP